MLPLCGRADVSPESNPPPHRLSAGSLRAKITHVDAGELGERIARAREVVGRTQGSLGKTLGLDRSAVSRIERGDRKVSVTELLAIAETLGRPLAFFVAEPVPAVVNRRRDGEHAHESNVLLDEELRSFSSDVQELLDMGIVDAVHRESLAVRSLHTHSDAEQAAVSVRERTDVGRSAAIPDLGQFCELLGLVTFAAALTPEGPDGGCVEVGTEGAQLGVALINGQAPSGRRRMTLAHELGHWLTGDAYDHEASIETEQMLNSFAIHLLAPRAGVSGVWTRHKDWSKRDRAIAVGAEFRLSWSAVIGQLRNLELITMTDYAVLSGNVPRQGEFAKLELVRRDEPAAPYLSPGFVSKVLRAYTTEELTAERTLELLRGTINDDDLPPRDSMTIENFRESFAGHGS
jgi:transcriptional regulator with XRE-family HTH domain/Zn-dependent peptidase ImmA (M78 family)